MTVSEKAMATHSSTLAWKIPWMEEPGRLQSMGSQSWTQLSDFTFTFHFSCIGEGNGNPLQCSCLESPRDGGGWWAAVCGVAQSWTRLKRLSSSSRGAKIRHASGLKNQSKKQKHIVTNSIMTLKMVHIKKYFKKIREFMAHN